LQIVGVFGPPAARAFEDVAVVQKAVAFRWSERIRRMASRNRVIGCSSSTMGSWRATTWTPRSIRTLVCSGRSRPFCSEPRSLGKGRPGSNFLCSLCS
jgi:hypothetical protein